MNQIILPVGTGTERAEESPLEHLPVQRGHGGEPRQGRRLAGQGHLRQNIYPRVMPYPPYCTQYYGIEMRSLSILSYTADCTVISPGQLLYLNTVVKSSINSYYSD